MHRIGYPKGTFHLPLRYVLCRGPQELAAFPGWEWLGHWLISRLFYSHVLAGWFRDQKLATMIWHYDLSMWFGFLTPWWPQCDSTHVVAQGSKHKHYEKREKLTWHFMILLEMTHYSLHGTLLTAYWSATETVETDTPCTDSRARDTGSTLQSKEYQRILRLCLKMPTFSLTDTR